MYKDFVKYSLSCPGVRPCGMHSNSHKPLGEYLVSPQASVPRAFCCPLFSFCVFLPGLPVPEMSPLQVYPPAFQPVLRLSQAEESSELQCEND